MDAAHWTTGYASNECARCGYADLAHVGLGRIHDANAFQQKESNMTELQKFNKWFDQSDHPGSHRPYMWAAWTAWLEENDAV